MITTIPYFLRHLDTYQLKLALAKPDDDINPAAFTVSTQGESIRIQVALGLEFHFPRGVAVRIGRSADKALNFAVIPNNYSRYALGQIHVDRALAFGGYRGVTIPKRALDYLNNTLTTTDELPSFRQRPADKVLFTRAGEFLLAVTP